MADSVEMQEIRGLKIDKTVKGFALTEYEFKNAVTVTSTDADTIRWYQETSTDLTATSPSAIANVGRLSQPVNLEHSWTRNTSYVRKYIAESFISMEDLNTADIPVLSRTLLRLTRAVVKQVDTRIWNVLTESQTAVNINSVTATAAWDAESGQDPIEDILEAKQKIEEAGYSADNATLWLSPKDYKSLMTWLISTKGASIPNFASEKVSTGKLTGFLGVKIKVNVNVTADYAALIVDKAAGTWYSLMDTTSRLIEEAGIGTKIRVWELGEAVLTDPKAVSLISNTQA